MSRWRELHERVRLAGLDRRQIGPDDLWRALDPLLAGGAGLAHEEVGRSAQERPLRLIRFGRGEARVLLWSQAHGNEPTGTMALADLVRLLASGEGPASRWERELSLLILPMLNPDGAARFQRENALGADVNADARAAYTPEMRALLGVHERARPAYAIELHDEDTSSRLLDVDRIAALSLQAPPFDEGLSDNDARLRAKRLCVSIQDGVEPLVGGRVARHLPAYSPATLGAQLQRQGTSTVLVETGWWPDDRELQFLRTVNFVALAAALEAIATRSFPPVDRYDQIPRSDRGVHDLLVRGGTLVVPGLEPCRADVGVDFEVRLELRNGHLAAVGDLADRTGIHTIDATGLFVHPDRTMLAREGGGFYLERGAPANFMVRRGPEPDSPVAWRVEGGVAKSADAA